MFNIEKHEATISNVNTRIERHGDERQLAADIKFTTSASNAVLDQFAPGLREALFRKPGKGEQQSLPTIGETLTAVKFPSLAPLKLAHEFTGYEVEIAGMLDDTDPLFLADVKLKKFEFAPNEGGSVQLTFTASANVDSEELAELCDALVREDVLLTLIAPARAADADAGEDDSEDDAAAAQAEADRLVAAGKQAA